MIGHWLWVLFYRWLYHDIWLDLVWGGLIHHFLWYDLVYCFLWRNVCCNWFWSDFFLRLVRIQADWGWPDWLALLLTFLLTAVLLGAVLAALSIAAAEDEEAGCFGAVVGVAVSLAVVIATCVHLADAADTATATVRALAADPVRARAYLAPGGTPDLDRIRALAGGANHPADLSGAGVRLRWHPAPEAVGALLEAAAEPNAEPHTAAGSTLAAATVLALHREFDDELPDALRPAVGRILRGYLNDVTVAMDEPAVLALSPQRTPYTRGPAPDPTSPDAPQEHAAFDHPALQSVLTALAAVPAENDALVRSELVYTGLIVRTLLGKGDNLKTRTAVIKQAVGGPAKVIATLDAARNKPGYQEEAESDKVRTLVVKGGTELVTEVIAALVSLADGTHLVGRLATNVVSQTLVNTSLSLFGPEPGVDRALVSDAVRRSIDSKRTFTSTVAAALWAGKAWPSAARPPDRLLDSGKRPLDLGRILGDEQLRPLFLAWLQNPAQESYLRDTLDQIAVHFALGGLAYNQGAGLLL
ncbi:hypothetical protein [Kitasatospora sp. NPDC093806]|uniref:hypothetical protein n=1 Tax=Kitasatospora sp. NPDC093806 TaxID=3155075 RepID=UPI003420B0C7